MIAIALRDTRNVTKLISKFSAHTSGQRLILRVSVLRGYLQARA